MFFGTPPEEIPETEISFEHLQGWTSQIFKNNHMIKGPIIH